MAAEYYVSPRGADDNSGASMDLAFKSVQKGCDRLKPGDTLTIAPGVYHEGVCFNNFNPAGATNFSVIQAERPGTAVLTGSRNVRGFRKVAGRQYTFAAEFDREVLRVVQLDTPKALMSVSSLDDVELFSGSAWYDSNNKKLYVHSTDGMDPELHCISAAVLKDGIALSHSGFVIIRGLVLTGYGENCVHGYASSDVIVEDSTLSFADRGIHPEGCKRWTVRGNHIFNMEPPFGMTSYHGLGVYVRSENGVFEKNIIHDTLVALYCYGVNDPGIIIRDNLCYNNDTGALFKGNRLPKEQFPAILNNVLVDNYGNDLVMVSGQGKDAWSSCTLSGSREASDPAGDGGGATKLPRNNASFRPGDDSPQFADPVNRDYRLQSDSPWRKAGPGGEDIGALAYRADVFFVRPDGDDRADGTSAASAWKTLARACAAARPGQTVLVMAGDYYEPLKPVVSGSEGKPIAFRARGKDRVVLDGQQKGGYGIDLSGLGHVAIEGFHVRGWKAGGVKIGAGAALELKRLVIQDNLGPGIHILTGAGRISRSIIAANQGGGIEVEHDAADVSVLGNTFFKNQKAQLIFIGAVPRGYYSEWNLFWHPGGPLAQIDNIACASLAQWQTQTGLDRAAQSAAPEFRDAGRGDFAFLPASPGSAGGWAGLPRGPEYALKPEAALAGVENLNVLDVTATTADLYWITPGFHGNTIVEYGQSNELGRRISQPTEFSSYHVASLRHLQPATRYHFRVKSESPGLDAHDNRGEWDRQAQRQQTVVESRLMTFTTLDRSADNYAGREYFVSKMGSDDNDGLSTSNAWATLSRASRAARAGDTVTVSGGIYTELLMPLRSGTPDRRIIFRAAPGEEVVIDAMNQRPYNIRILGKDSITIEGFHLLGSTMFDFKGYAGGTGYSPMLALNDAKDIVIRGCYFDCRFDYHSALIANFCEDILIEDCLYIQAWIANQFYRCKGTIGFIHNTASINCFKTVNVVNYHNGELQKFIARNNIFSSAEEQKCGVNPRLAFKAVPAELDMDYNCYLKMPYDEVNFIVSLNSKQGEIKNFKGPDSLRQWQGYAGQDQHSLTVEDAVFREPYLGREHSLSCRHPETGFYSSLPPAWHKVPEKINWNAFQLAAGSPCKGKGENGSDPGIRYDRIGLRQPVRITGKRREQWISRPAAPAPAE